MTGKRLTSSAWAARVSWMPEKAPRSWVSRESRIAGAELLMIASTLKFETIYGEQEAVPLQMPCWSAARYVRAREHMVYDELIGAAEDEEAGPVG